MTTAAGGPSGWIAHWSTVAPERALLFEASGRQALAGLLDDALHQRPPREVDLAAQSRRGPVTVRVAAKGRFEVRAVEIAVIEAVHGQWQADAVADRRDALVVSIRPSSREESPSIQGQAE